MSDKKEKWLEEQQRKQSQASYTAIKQMIKQGEPNVSLPTVTWREFRDCR